MSTPCPAPDRLQALLSGELSAADQHPLTEHLEDCERCRQRLEELAGSVEGLYNTSHAPENEDATASPAMKRVIDILRATNLFGRAEAQSATATDEGIDFLTPTQKPGFIGAFGPYEVIEVVGRGGMGIVLKVRDPSLHRVVAIKVLSPTLATSSTARKRFIREARAAAAISHDHVVTIHAVDEINHLPYLMMQFISGRSLQKRIDDTGPLKVEEILRIGMQTASGLAAAHAIGLVHRDIKPANILLENGIERAMLTDFGLAQAAHDAAITQTGLISGTPEYMAPEQIRDEPIDYRADLFAFGGVLYTMCTGRPPFAGSNPLSIMRKVCDESPTPIREINQDIPEWLIDIINRLLEKNPAQRYRSAAEVAQLLSDRLAQVYASPATTHAPIHVRPSPGHAAHRHPRWLRVWPRHRLVAGSMFTLVAMAALTLCWALFWRGRGQVPSPAPTPFVVHSTGSASPVGFATLGEAINAAPPGATIDIRANAFVQTDPITVRQKPLLIRAAEGYRPTIKWQAGPAPLISTDSRLVLEGLELWLEVPPSTARGPQRPLFKLMDSQAGDLYAANCKFVVRTQFDIRPTDFAICLNGVSTCELRNCQFSGLGTSIRWSNPATRSGTDQSGNTLNLHNCVHGGFELFLLASDSKGPASLRLSNSTLLGARLVGDGDLPSRGSIPVDPSARGVSVNVECSNSVLDCHQIMATMYAGAVRSSMRWNGQRNLFAVGGAFILGYPNPRMVGKAAQTIVGTNPDDWRKYWPTPEAGSVFAKSVRALRQSRW